MTLDTSVMQLQSAIDDATARLTDMVAIAVPGSQRLDPNIGWENCDLCWRFIPLPQPDPRQVASGKFQYNYSLVATLTADPQHGLAAWGVENSVFWTYIPTVLAYFKNHRNLVYKSTHPPQKPPCYFKSGVGLSISYLGGLPPTKEGAPSLGARFQIILPFQINLDGRLV